MLVLFVSIALLSVATDAQQGGYLFRPEAMGWLKVHPLVATWEEAFATCWNEGYALVASPNTMELRNEIRNVIGEERASYFIGTTSSFYPGSHFESIEGIYLEDMPIGDLLGAFDPQGNGCLSFDGVKIRPVSCAARLPFICYKKQDKLVPAVNKCGTRDNGYEFFEATGSCYKLHKTATNWTTSYKTCAEEDGYLAVLNDEAEAKLLTEFAYKQLNVVKESAYVSIGLRARDGKGDWLSVHGHRVEEIFNTWASVEGKPANPASRCGRLYHIGKLDDGDCDFNRPFICEKNPVKVQFLESTVQHNYVSTLVL